MPYRASPTRRLKMIGIDTKKDVETVYTKTTMIRLDEF